MSQLPGPPKKVGNRVAFTATMSKRTFAMLEHWALEKVVSRGVILDKAVDRLANSKHFKLPPDLPKPPHIRNLQ